VNIMGTVRHGSPSLAILLLVTPFAHAQVRSEAPSIVTHYCSGCHGLNGRSQLRYIPRLAGMRAAYLDSKFAAYKSATRAPVDEALNRLVHPGQASEIVGLTTAARAEMVGVARVVSGKDAKAAIEWYASQQPAPAKDQNAKGIEQGRRLYTDGFQDSGMRACLGCHGPSAQGSDTAPRLAGQNAAYVLGQLALFRSGERRDESMIEIARHLEDAQARAVAAYLQSR
jgi:cytochrome c553